MNHKRWNYALVDLGGVIFASTGKDSQLIDWEIVSELNWKYGHELNIGLDRFGAFLKDYTRKSGIQIEGAAFLEAIFDTLQINQELINYLQEHFEKVFILSDNYRENIEYIAERYQFQNWAERQFYSYQYGRTKEDPQLFEIVLQELGLAAADILFIDDSPGKIAVARSLGIRSVLFQNNKDLFSILQSNK